MDTGLFIAARYLFARKSHNVINVISAISAAGMAIGTAALILILSVCNGFDAIIEKNMSDLDPDITIRSCDGGSFVQSNTGITEYTYSEPGTYTITQRVTATVDGQTVTDEFSRTVTVDGSSTPEPTPEPEDDGMMSVVGIALAALGAIVLAAGAYTRNYMIAAVAMVAIVIGAVLWWMS